MSFVEIIERLQKEKPVIHHITNFVTMESCADIALSVGASPFMADASEEVERISGAADAIVINLGTINSTRMKSMEKACKSAKANGKPVILDPVGVMSSALRLEFATKLLKTGSIKIIRGNYNECHALLEEVDAERGIDAKGNYEQGECVKVAKELATKYNCVVALTGEIDYVSDGSRVILLNGGDVLLTKITGAGCMTTTLCACCAAVAEDYFVAATLGVVIMGQGAELATSFLERKDGPGMFKVRLIDGVYHVVTQWSAIELNPEKVENN